MTEGSNNISTVKIKNWQSKILYLAKISSRNEGGIKTFTGGTFSQDGDIGTCGT